MYRTVYSKWKKIGIKWRHRNDWSAIGAYRSDNYGVPPHRIPLYMSQYMSPYISRNLVHKSSRESQVGNGYPFLADARNLVLLWWRKREWWSITVSIFGEWDLCLLQLMGAMGTAHAVNEEGTQGREGKRTECGAQHCGACLLAHGSQFLANLNRSVPQFQHAYLVVGCHLSLTVSPMISAQMASSTHWFWGLFPPRVSMRAFTVSLPEYAVAVKRLGGLVTRWSLYESPQEKKKNAKPLCIGNASPQEKEEER